MNDINQYTIYCTPDQTKKALELGASIHSQDYKGGIITINHRWFRKNNKCYRCPTAEQMIGWLREKDLSVEVMNVYQGGKKWISIIWNIKETQLIKETIEFDDYKGAILAGIDAALDYLISNKG